MPIDSGRVWVTRMKKVDPSRTNAPANAPSAGLRAPSSPHSAISAAPGSAPSATLPLSTDNRTSMPNDAASRVSSQR
jgi:hypothetical protein